MLIFIQAFLVMFFVTLIQECFGKLDETQWPEVNNP